MYKKIKRIIAIIAVLILICSISTGCSQEDDKAAKASTVMTNSKLEGISQDNMMKIIEELTSEKYKGRLAGSEGNILAAQYIADYFKKIGLENPKDLTYYTYVYEQPLVKLKEKPVMELLDEKGSRTVDFSYPENFVLRRLSSETNSININAPLYLIDDAEMLYRDNSKLKDKLLLLPWEYYSLLGSQNDPEDYAEITGALGIISEFDLEKNDLGYKYLKVRPLSRTGNMPDSYKPFAFVDSDTFSQLAKAAESGNKLHFACNSETDNLNISSNCIGLIPGSDVELKDEFIIIGAHFDHVGDNIDGTWNPGALDNASGTAAMMELARIIKESETPPKKSILFMAFNGEEGGLVGSRSYCRYPIYPLDKSVMINLDMIGSTGNIPLSIATAFKNSDSSLRDTLTAYADELSIAYKKDIDSGSDHVAFDIVGVPSVCLVNLDLSLGYHSPHDTIETVNEDRLKEAVELVLYYIEKNAY